MGSSPADPINNMNMQTQNDTSASVRIPRSGIVLVSGGQSGADQGGLRAGTQLGLGRRGWAPKNWSTEVGVVPSVFRLGMLEHAEYNPLARTQANVACSDLTLCFMQHTVTTGTVRTQACAQTLPRPCLLVDLALDQATLATQRGAIQRAILRLYTMPERRRGDRSAWATARGLVGNHTQSVWVNIAGSRETLAPGIGERVKQFLVDTLDPLLEPR